MRGGVVRVGFDRSDVDVGRFHVEGGELDAEGFGVCEQGSFGGAVCGHEGDREVAGYGAHVDDGAFCEDQVRKKGFCHGHDAE